MQCKASFQTELTTTTTTMTEGPVPLLGADAEQEEEREVEDNLSNLNHDIIKNILSHLTIRELFSVGATNKKLEMVGNEFVEWIGYQITCNKQLRVFLKELNDIKTNIIHLDDDDSMKKKIHRFETFVANWNVSELTDFSFAFYNLTMLQVDISGWDLSKATCTRGMLAGATSMESDLSGWDLGNVQDTQGMLYGASKQTKAYAHGWTITELLKRRMTFPPTLCMKVVPTATSLAIRK